VRLQFSNPVFTQDGSRDRLSESYLYETYPYGHGAGWRIGRAGTRALETDYLSERGSDYNTYRFDSNEMLSRPGYGHSMYATARFDSYGNTLWLQYWHFYYYNGLAQLRGRHEGDWEVVMVGIANPCSDHPAATYGAYAQHNGGERCAWRDMERADPRGENPVVYVAANSHASYFFPGEYHWVDIDNALGDYLTVWPALRSVGPWIQWPGSWGDSDSSPGGASIW